MKPIDPLPGAITLTYLAVRQSEPVQTVGREWLLEKGRLARRRDLILALGIVASGSDRLAERLDIGSGFQAGEAKERLERLNRLYPDCTQAVEIPEAIASVLEARITR